MEMLVRLIKRGWATRPPVIDKMFVLLEVKSSKESSAFW